MLQSYLAGLTDIQLERLYGRINKRMGSGGPYGWDWPTLWAVYPGYARVLRAINNETWTRLYGHGDNHDG